MVLEACFIKVVKISLNLIVLETGNSFLGGCDMPKFISHACFVLLSKVEHPNKFS